MTPEQQEVLDEMAGPGRTANIAQTLVRHPEAARGMVHLGGALRSGDIPARHREILILRTGWNCQSQYELAQHYRMARHIGMTDEDMARIRSGPDASGWDPFEAALCRAADDLHATQTVGDEAWSTLGTRYDDRQLMQVTLLVGYYHLVSFVLNTAGVPLEANATPFPLS